MNPELLACTYTGFIIWNFIIYMAEYKEKHNRSTLMCQDLIKKKYSQCWNEPKTFCVGQTLCTLLIFKDKQLQSSSFHLGDQVLFQILLYVYSARKVQVNKM